MFKTRVPKRRSNLSNVVKSQRSSRVKVGERFSEKKSKHEQSEGAQKIDSNGSGSVNSTNKESISSHLDESRPGSHSNSDSDSEPSSNSSSDCDSDYDDSSLSQNQIKDDIPAAFLERLMSFSLFNNAPELFYIAIARKLKLLVYHPHEFVVKAGEPALAMYWILRGSVNVTSPDGEIVHAELVEGSYFGEIGILFKRPRTATVISKTKVLLGVLTAETFNQVLLHFPQIERQIRDEAQERLATQEKQRKAGVSKIIHDNDFIVRQRSPTCIANDQNIQPIYPSPGSYSDTAISSVTNSTVIFPLQQESSDKLLEERILPPQLPERNDSSSPTNQSLGNPIYTETIDDTISTRQFLKSLPLFTALPANAIHELALSVEIKQVPPFEYVFRKNDIGEDIYFIISGEVEVLGPSTSKIFPGKNVAIPSHKIIDVVLARLGPGQYFGEMGFLSSITDDVKQKSKCKRSAGIRTVSNCTLLVLTGDTLRDFCARFPETQTQIKQTAEERMKKNVELRKNNDTEYQTNSSHPDLAALISPISQKGYINLLNDQTRKIQSQPLVTVDSLLSQTSESSLDLYNEPNNKSLFKSNFSFDNQSQKETSMQQIRKPASPTFTPVSGIGASLSVASSGSLLGENSIKNDEALQQQPLELHVPPLNGALKRRASAFSTRSPSPMQYMGHLKRARLSNIGGGPSRRRSSVLSVGPLPDRLLLRCFQYIPLPELMKLRLVCRRWRQLLYVAPGLFDKLDLTAWSTSIDDKALHKITDFVGSRSKCIDISNCFHVTDEGFSYMVNEIGIGGCIKSLKMTSCWEISAMAIMDIAVPSIGKFLEEINLSNCRKVRDDVIQRLLGWDVAEVAPSSVASSHNNQIGSLYPLDEPIPDVGFSYWSYQMFPKLKTLIISECIFLTDNSIRSILNSCPNLAYLNVSFCCSLTDAAIELIRVGGQNLEQLDISFCGRAVSDISLLNISMHLRKLEQISLKGCLRVTRSGVDSLLGGYAPLKRIDISQCKNAHIYQGGVQATLFKTSSGSKSVFLTMEDSSRCVEVII
ncbi:F-box/LRR-repeat protein 2 [Kluyveromyces marxianus]